VPPKASAATPPPTSRHSVLIESEGAIPLAPTAPAASTLRGSTANFDVSYDSSLGSNGQALADAVLGNCEADLAKFEGFFGIGSPGRFTVSINPGPGGASHAGCSARGINCAAWTGDGALENFLNCAEVAEVFMASQNAGWNCGASAGEGLSRILAFELHPASQWLQANRGGFITASFWLNNGRPDWITQTEPTDIDKVSIGCATLFLNYLRHQLHFSLNQIVQAGGTTLQQTYERLTGSSVDAFGPFAALLAAYFPPGTLVNFPPGTLNLPTDNPFPLSHVPGVVFDGANGAAKEVVRAGLVPLFTGPGAARPGSSFVNSQSPAAGQVVPGGSTVTMRLVIGPTP
jgi:hypothetical protein